MGCRRAQPRLKVRVTVPFVEEADHCLQVLLQAVPEGKHRVILEKLGVADIAAHGLNRAAFKHYFARHGATVLMLDDLTTETTDKTVHSVAHGVIQLEMVAPTYGAERRRLNVFDLEDTCTAGMSPCSDASLRMTGWTTF